MTSLARIILTACYNTLVMSAGDCFQELDEVGRDAIVDQTMKALEKLGDPSRRARVLDAVEQLAADDLNAVLGG